MVEKELLRLTLNNKFFNDNKSLILRSMFPSNLQNVFDIIRNTHEKLNKDINKSELKAIWSANNPVASEAQKKALFLLIDDLPTEISDEVAKEVLKKAHITECGRRLGQIGAEIINGKTPEIEKAKQIIEEIETGRISQLDELEPLSNQLEDILEAIDLTQKWKFNLTKLQENIPGIGPGIFKAAFGRIETGKSGYWISLAAAPDGFAHQGARTFAYCNEEAAQRSQARAVMACTGRNIAELNRNLANAKSQFAKIAKSLQFYEVKGASIYQLEAHIKNNKPDIFIIDQLDKVSIDGSFTREDERLGALYIRTRDICTKYGCAAIAISQANAEAEGKAYLSTANMALARTSKAAEVDILVGIGKSPLHDDTSRVLNIVKNKISGNHNDVVCRLIPEISRYVD